jgi:glycosyltransferase involved in cell wall biosynthesis
MAKKVLIVSNGPVPPMQGYKIEGGGQRSWGLALGLTQNQSPVTVAVPITYSIGSDETAENIALVNWSSLDNLASLANKHDAVIVSYSSGKTAEFIAKHIKDSMSLILDCYVPIYVEISARESESVPNDYINYMVDLSKFNKSLKRGDYFLYANEPQKHFYTGVLSALGVINPYSYKNFSRLLHVPSGVDRDTTDAVANPYLDLGIKEDDFVLLWFGGLYPWFDISSLLKCMPKINQATPSHLVIVGGKNPYNQNVDIQKQFFAAQKYVDENNLDKVIHFVDWVDYSVRLSYYKHANAVISINKSGDENQYSWRTRVMDYIWGETPVITNGGDPLSELLIESNAAIKISNIDEKSISKILIDITKNDEKLTTMKKNIKSVKASFYWDKVVIPIKDALETRPNPDTEEEHFKSKIKLYKLRLWASRSSIASRLLRIRKRFFRLIKAKS